MVVPEDDDEEMPFEPHYQSAAEVDACMVADDECDQEGREEKKRLRRLHDELAAGRKAALEKREAKKQRLAKQQEATDEAATGTDPFARGSDPLSR